MLEKKFTLICYYVNLQARNCTYTTFTLVSSSLDFCDKEKILEQTYNQLCCLCVTDSLAQINSSYGILFPAGQHGLFWWYMPFAITNESSCLKM